MKTEPKVLEANEVTKPGRYWHRHHPNGVWKLVSVENNDEGELAWYYLGNPEIGFIPKGQFRGPVSSSEQSDAKPRY